MELVDGLVLRDEDEVEAAFDEAEPRGGSPRRSSTRSPTCTPSTPTPSASASSAAATATSSASSSAGCASGRPPRRASCDAMDETHRLLSARVPAAARDLARARRLPARQRDRHAAGRDRRGARLGAVHARRPARRRRPADGLLGRAERRGRPAHARADARARLPDAARSSSSATRRAPAATSPAWTSSSRSPTGSWRRSSRACTRATRPASTARPPTSSRSFGKIVEQLAGAALRRRAPPRVKGASMASDNVFAIVLAGGEGKRLAPLTADRAKPAVPFGGNYRLIDFALSNFVNAGYLQDRRAHAVQEPQPRPPHRDRRGGSRRCSATTSRRCRRRCAAGRTGSRARPTRSTRTST